MFIYLLTSKVANIINAIQ